MPLITFSSDIGQQDYLVGAIKGQIYSAIKDAVVADISHYLSRDNFFQAAYICKNAYQFFPNNTIHLLLLNVFENKESHFIVAEVNNQLIVCPNNGIITMIADNKPSKIVTIPVINAYTLIDITAEIVKVIAEIANGKALDKVGTEALSIVEKEMMKPMVGKDWIEGQVLFIDNFENIIINITKEEFDKERNGRKFKIIFGRNEYVDAISNNYSHLSNSENLAWFNSAGYLEISNKGGNLAGLFGIKEYNLEMQKNGIVQQNKWFYQTVRIFFE